MSDRKALVDVLAGKVPERRPVWLMRQAGRYLPEYREVRATAGSFLALCDSPKLAMEVTLQPLRRFDLDAAIVFADILLIPRALGSRLEFREQEGPVLSPVRSQADVDGLGEADGLAGLDPVLETLRLVRALLPSNQALIGFCGAPWTVASYMIEGGTSEERLLSRRLACERPVWFGELLARLTTASAEYLARQCEAGADVLQIFDSWAGDLPESLHEELVFGPVRRVVQEVRRRVGPVPIIGFARGIGAAHLGFAKNCGLNAVSVEPSVPLQWLRDEVVPHAVVQGNLDPLVLAGGGEALKSAVRRIVATLPPHSHVMNLGHGVRQETPPEHVGELVASVRRWDGEAHG
ncbi:MAG: uroporphyrinogen decarboxylase [Pseudomonadota bacterium]|nr:uroporphyrinogen decarboxylase [Pseudomonadota bacterium]